MCVEPCRMCISHCFHSALWLMSDLRGCVSEVRGPRSSDALTPRLSVSRASELLHELLGDFAWALALYVCCIAYRPHGRTNELQPRTSPGAV